MKKKKIMSTAALAIITVFATIGGVFVFLLIWAIQPPPPYYVEPEIISRQQMYEFDKRDKDWPLVVEGKRYYKGTTDWYAGEIETGVGYQVEDDITYNVMTLKNDPDHDFLLLGVAGGWLYENMDSETKLYCSEATKLPQVDLETVDRIRFYIGEGDRDAQKEDLQQGNVTEDKELIKRFLDAKGEGIDTFEGEPHFVGLLSLESDQYPMLACIYGVYQNDSGIYAPVLYEGEAWSPWNEIEKYKVEFQHSYHDWFDIPQDVMLALMGQTG